MIKYSSRKFITAMLCLASAHFSLIGALIDGEQYKVIVIAILALYGAANVAQKAMVKNAE
jgi:hypothetical protein